MTESTAAEPAIDAEAMAASRWSIDRRIPVAMIVLLLTKFGLICAAFAVLSWTVNAQGARISTIEVSREARHETEAKSLVAMQVDIARIVERVDSILAMQRRHEEAARP